jgi:hypothetical protein
LDSVKIIVVAEMYTTHMFKESAKRILNIWYVVPRFESELTQVQTFWQDVFPVMPKKQNLSASLEPWKMWFESSLYAPWIVYHSLLWACKVYGGCYSKRISLLSGIWWVGECYYRTEVQ